MTPLRKTIHKRLFGDNHKVKIGKKRSKTNGIKLGKMTSGCGGPQVLEFYLDLLDWTGRNLAAGKRGAIPDHLEPILQRIGIVSSGWCDLIQQFGRLFKRAVGSPQALANEAKARGQKYLHGTKATAFATS